MKDDWKITIDSGKIEPINRNLITHIRRPNQTCQVRLINCYHQRAVSDNSTEMQILLFSFITMTISKVLVNIHSTVIKHIKSLI